MDAKSRLTATAAILLAGCACGGPPGLLAPTRSRSSDRELETFARASNELGWRVYARLATEDEPNVVYSPISAQLVLSMLETGAAGETRDELLAILNGGQPEEGLVRASNASLYSWRDRGGDLPLHVSNRLFVDRGFAIRAQFETTLRERFGAEVASADFRGDLGGSRELIRSWLREVGRSAPEVDLGPATRLVAVSHVRFDGAWATPFTEGMTTPAPFHRAEGEAVLVPTMHAPPELTRYGVVDGAVVVELPYASARFSMLLVRPAGSAPLGELEPTPERLGTWVAQLSHQRIELYLPRFRFGPTAVELAPHLSALGIARAFDPRRSDFARMATGDEPLVIGSMLQSVEIEVNERGTRAEAATMGAVVPAAAGEPVTVRFDCPFLFVLRERRSGIVLFLGHVGDPSAS